MVVDEVLERADGALRADLVGEVQGLVCRAARLLVVPLEPLRVGHAGEVEGVGAHRASVEGAGGGREGGFRVARAPHGQLGGGPRALELGEVHPVRPLGLLLVGVLLRAVEMTLGLVEVGPAALVPEVRAGAGAAGVDEGLHPGGGLAAYGAQGRAGDRLGLRRPVAVVGGGRPEGEDVGSQGLVVGAVRGVQGGLEDPVVAGAVDIEDGPGAHPFQIGRRGIEAPAVVQGVAAVGQQVGDHVVGRRGLMDQGAAAVLVVGAAQRADLALDVGDGGLADALAAGDLARGCRVGGEPGEQAGGQGRRAEDEGPAMHVAPD
ncbi:hypothetical protein ACFYPK_28310 [Streptomyces halstedii]|uniref:hypothetical protein n=1 Tax=Streptomyces halstedii TaxID=1944 RepID=UPI0034600F60